MKLAIHILLAYLVLTLLFTGALVAAFAIPGAAVKDNLQQSVQQVTDDGKMFTAMRNACIEAGLLPRKAYSNMTEAECKEMIRCVEMNMGENK